MYIWGLSMVAVFVFHNTSSEGSQLYESELQFTFTAAGQMQRSPWSNLSGAHAASVLPTINKARSVSTLLWGTMRYVSVDNVANRQSSLCPGHSENMEALVHGQQVCVGGYSKGRKIKRAVRH